MPVPTTVQEAFDRLRERWLAQEQIDHLLPYLEETRAARGTLPATREEPAAREEHARKMAALARSLRESGRTSQASYVYSIDFWIGSRVHEGRWLDGKYEELTRISERLDEGREEYGLAPGETWLRGEGPDEWRELNREYERLLEDRLAPTLREFGYDDVADLLESDPDRYNQLSEQGRKAVFQKPDQQARLSELEARYRAEADRAHSAQAFYGAAALRGAALEALLLRRVLQHQETIHATIAGLERRHRPRSPDPARWTLAELLSVAAAAGWLPDIELSDAIVNVENFARLARELRNLLHPGRHLELSPDWSIEEAEVEDATTLVLLVDWLLEKAGPERS
jgi:hypothetical protein